MRKVLPHPNFVHEETEGSGRGTRPVTGAGTGARTPGLTVSVTVTRT